MRKNDHMGVVYLSVGGVGEVELRYDWRAIADLHGKYGKEWDKEFARVIEEMDLENLAFLMASASKYDVRWWMEHSPPVVESSLAIQEALQLAFFGPKGMEENPQTALQSMIRSLKAIVGGSNLEGVPQTSGK